MLRNGLDLVRRASCFHETARRGLAQAVSDAAVRQARVTNAIALALDLSGEKPAT
jgi:hypothetical protein